MNPSRLGEPSDLLVYIVNKGLLKEWFRRGADEYTRAFFEEERDKEFEDQVDPDVLSQFRDNMASKAPQGQGDVRHSVYELSDWIRESCEAYDKNPVECHMEYRTRHYTHKMLVLIAKNYVNLFELVNPQDLDPSQKSRRIKILGNIFKRFSEHKELPICSARSGPQKFGLWDTGGRDPAQYITEPIWEMIGLIDNTKEQDNGDVS